MREGAPIRGIVAAVICCVTQFGAAEAMAKIGVGKSVAHPGACGKTSKKCVLRSSGGVKRVFAFFEEDLPMRDVELLSP